MSTRWKRAISLIIGGFVLFLSSYFFSENGWVYFVTYFLVVGTLIYLHLKIW